MSAADPAAELAELRRWRPRAGARHKSWFEQLVRNEFLTPDAQRIRQCTALHRTIRHAVDHVPYYRAMFKRLGLHDWDILDPKQLVNLPVLRRSDVQDNAEPLLATQLPPGEAPVGYKQTSGSTGQPVRILHTRQSAGMNTLLIARDMRWFRHDPHGTLASIRPAVDLPRRPDGGEYREGETCRRPHWPLIGHYFETGPYIGFAGTNPVDAQIDWLNEHRPDYLLALAARHEHLALAAQERPGPDSLRGLMSIGQTMTPVMRQRIEAVFACPVDEDYGLNEIGMVATRCPQGERFHVHTEYCLVEIVDDEGTPVAPGEIGHLLVTALCNAAMPLLRYDTGDLAEAVDGPCPCGRTLPSFAGLRGRYSRLAYLPPGTIPRWAALEACLEQMPGYLIAPVRRYQVHQSRDRSTLFRIVAGRPLAAQFHEHVRRAWDSVQDGEDMALVIEQVREIPTTGNQKFERFTSVFTPPPDSL
jgi:phenylacetate-CoA ligase